MSDEKRRSKRLVGLFLLGLLLSVYPILSLCNLNVMILGFPMMYLYVFGYWAALILLMALLCELPSGQQGRNRSRK